jgi:hypothetical protein
MRSIAVPLVPVFRSRVQAEILAALLLNDEETAERTVGELAALAQAPLATVSDEVGRLESAQILRTRKIGTARLVQVNREHPAVAPLTELARISHGPALIIPRRFAELDAIAVLIFGSWAERYFGTQGRPPRDIDVLVLADEVQRSDIYDAADAASADLAITVNPVVRPTRAWNDSSDPLITEIREHPFLVTNGALP